MTFLLLVIFQVLQEAFHLTVKKYILVGTSNKGQSIVDEIWSNKGIFEFPQNSIVFGVLTVF